MFPSTGHFKSLHCPFHLENECRRIYCHFRHVKSITEKSAENNQIITIKNQLCKNLRIDEETFHKLMDESDEHVQEKNLNCLLKKLFPRHAHLIDDFRLPETTSKDAFDLLQSNDPSDETVCDLINLTEPDDDTSLDEGPLKQFLEEDAKRNSNSEQQNRNTLEKRHIIISCLEKMDKREHNPRRAVQPKKLSTLTKDSSVEDSSLIDMSEAETQPVINDSIKIKQEDDGSDSSGSEDNAEVDSILNQMELLNPQLFSSEKSYPVKREPVDSECEKENEYELNLASQETVAASQTYASDNTIDIAPASSTSSPFLQPKPPQSNTENRYGRINPKSVQAINNEASSLVSTASKDVKSELNNRHERVAANAAILTAASIAEQNRLKNVFKNTICANIDQFFDLCDACKVYGTEIFNLLEPLLNYLIEKLNPEFNFEKLRQLHSQNISLTCGLALAGSCDHANNCIECHNLLQCAMVKCNVKKVDRCTQATASSLDANSSSLTDTPLRKIEAGLYDITKEIISLGIPMDESELAGGERSRGRQVEMKHVQCQTESSSSSHSRRSSHDHRHHGSGSSSTSNSKKHSRSSSSSTRESSSRHKSKDAKSSSESRKRQEDTKRRSSEKQQAHSRHSRNEHRSSRSSNESRKRSSKRVEKSQSDEESADEEREKSSKRRRSSGGREPETKKRSSDEKGSSLETKKRKSDDSAIAKSHSEHKKSTPIEQVTITVESSSEETADDNDESDDFDNIPGLTVSDAESDKMDSPKNDDLSSSEDTEEKQDSDEFVDKYPTIAGKKRISHVTESTNYLAQRKHIAKKNIPSPAEVLFQRMQQSKKAEPPAEPPSNLLTNDRIRISHVPNVALLLKAKERIKNNLYQVGKPVASPALSAAQTIAKGSSRIAHVPSEPPKPKDVPAIAANTRPVINSYKNTNNIPVPTRQNGLDRLYNAFAKKVPPDLASELALKEEKTIHEKVTITKIYLNSLAMAIHRISKEDSAKLVQKNTEFPPEINGFATYDLLSKHLLTYEQLEINGFPLGIVARPGCCRISTKAIHYKPLASKRSGDRFYCLQCKDLFDVNPETGIPITSGSGCKFHQLRPRKEPGRTRHDVFFPCCNKGISESGCVSAEYHTPDTTDDDCLEGFLETREAPPGESTKTFYSLDCEMCYTTVGPELTRVTIIGPDCSTVYDSLVKPKNKILDYCTKFSGITKEKLRHVTKTLEEVRRDLFKFIFKDTILIGHSLENDLKSLKILHYNIVDTSVMYPHRDAPERKFALKFISAREVQFLIQESEFGHDSKEDALACMKLVWKKIREDAQSYRPRKIIGSPERSK